MNPPDIAWRERDSFVVSDVEYVCRPVHDRFASTPERFCLLKAPWQVESYSQLLHDVAPQTMVEVGMFDGASMALTGELARPRTLVGIDNRATPSAALTEFIARHALENHLRPHYGVDQADTERLRTILAAEIGDEPLDLVVDDASHLYDETRCTFNELFPRLRPGGMYVVEDWPTHRIPHDPPLAMLLLELSLATSDTPRCVAGMRITKNDVVVTRGPADLDPAVFDLRDCLGPRAQAFIATLPGVRTNEAPTM